MSEKENKIKQVGRAFEDLKNYIINNFDNYKDNEFLIIDWENLNNYDSNLATMILEKPEKTIEYIKKIICQEKKCNHVKIINNPIHVNLNEIGAKHHGKLITVNCIINKVNQLTQVLDISKFECRSCLRIHEIKQTSEIIQEPALCTECGGRSFKLLKEESIFKDIQILSVTNTKMIDNLEAILTDNLCSRTKFYKGMDISLTAIPKTSSKDKNKFIIKLLVNNIKINENKTNIELSDDEYRNSKEYTEWREEILKRDNECQCCG